MSTRVLLLCAVFAALALPASGSSTNGAPAGYQWPIKPFDQPHPIRSSLGEPRTNFKGPPVPETLYAGAGSFSFERGVDIVAPDGTAVYPVRSGVAYLQGGRTVVVRSGPGVSAEYWHIVPAVRNGQHVVAYRTMLGRIRHGYGHVHFTEIEGGRVVNPLALGELSPYQDHGTPSVTAIEFRHPGTATELMPELVRGPVELDAEARDDPDPALTGRWARFATVPALVTWHVERASNGKQVIGEQHAFDVRTTLPPNRDFWHFYARGTRQHEATFAGHRYWRQEGVFLFRLGVLDTRRLPNGIYRLVVTATDIRGNSGAAQRTFLVWNKAGWPPITPQA